MDGPWGLVRVFAPPMDASPEASPPDTFVLCDAQASGPEDAAYWSERTLADAHEVGSGTWDVLFDDHANSASGERRCSTAELVGSQAPMTLRHRPGGGAAGERVAFGARPAPQVFTSGKGAYPYLWAFMAVEVMLGDTVRAPAVLLDGFDEVELRQPEGVRGKPDPLEQGPPLAGWTVLRPEVEPAPPAPLTSAARRAGSSDAWRPRLVDPEARVWPAGTAPPDPPPFEHAADETDGMLLAQALPGTETWLTIVEAPRGFAAGPGAPFADGTGEAADAADAFPEQPPPRYVATYRCEPDGRYRYAVYPDADAPGVRSSQTDSPDARASNAKASGGAAPSPPEPVGPPAPYVLVDLGLARQKRTLYGGCHPVALPREALEQLTQPRAPLAATWATPFDMAPGLMSDVSGEQRLMEALGRGADWNWTRGTCRWYLPDPLRVLQRRARQVYSETRRLTEWTAAVADAHLNAGLAAAVCYRADHRRPYLTDSLARDFSGFDAEASATAKQVTYGATDVEALWAGFDAPGTTDDAGRRPSYVEQTLWALDKQRAYLRHRARVAANRVEQWLSAPGLLVTLTATAAAETSGAAPDGLARACGALGAGSLSAMVSGGGGGRMLAEWTEAVGLDESLRAVCQALEAAQSRTEGDDAELELDALLDGLVEASRITWGDLVSAEALGVVWLLVEKGGEAAAALALTYAVTPVFLSKQRTVVRKAPEVLLAAFAWRLTAQHDSGRVRIYAGTAPMTSLAPPAPGEARARPWRHRLLPLARVGDVEVVARGPAARTETRFADRVRYDAVSFRYVSSPGARRLAGTLDEVLAGAEALYILLQSVDAAQRGTFGFEDALGLGEGLAEAGSLIGSRAGATAVARMAVRGAACFEVAQAGYGVWSAVTAVQARGAQDVAAPDWFDAAGNVTIGGGGIVLASVAAAFAKGATSVSVLGATTALGPAAVIGLALVAGGMALSWWGERQAVRARVRDDKLSDWLATQSLWGHSAPALAEQRARIIALALPLAPTDPVPDAPDANASPAQTLEAQTGAFVRAAFVFPIGVEVRHRREALEGGRVRAVPDRLALTLVPLYVPTAATLLVSARVTPVDRTGRERAEDAVRLRFAVHYVRTDSALRYRVVPEGERLDVPEGPGTLTERLARLAEQHAWPRAVPGSYSAEQAGGRVHYRPAEALAVHVGPWRSFEASQAEAAEPMAAAPDATAAVAARPSEAFEAAWAVEARTLVEAAALGAVLGTGRFRVSGFAYFHPLTPILPAPGSDAYEDNPSHDTLRAFAEIGGPDGYSYHPHRR